jgi:hypothetical protein
MKKATHRGILPIGDLQIPCFVLDDGTRVISGRGMTKAIGMKGRGQGVERIATHRTLRAYILDELREALIDPIQFLPSDRAKRPLPGYEATILLRVCDAILQARDSHVLATDQERRYAQYADTLVRAFAKVGIIALVDEATGYQVDRAQDELARLLAAYISPELLPWTKRFPDEFYKELFRLRGWRYIPLSVARPKAVAKFTSDLVYDKLPDAVVEELRRLNPVIDLEGHRAHRHHQFLTEGIGNRHLEMHLAQVITLMRISPNWGGFMRNFNRAFPPLNTMQQQELPLELEDK